MPSDLLNLFPVIVTLGFSLETLKKSLISFFDGILVVTYSKESDVIFNESIVCNVENQSKNLSKEQLLKELNQNLVSCKDVTFRILGLSLAAINTILSVVLSIIFLKLFFNYGSNSTSQYK